MRPDTTNADNGSRSLIANVLGTAPTADVRVALAAARWIARLVSAAIVPRLAILLALSTLLWPRTSHAVVVVWFIASALLELLGLLMANRLERDHPSDIGDALVGVAQRSASRAATRLSVTAVLEGLVWVALLLISRHSDDSVVQLIAVVAAIAAIAVNMAIHASARRSFILAEVLVGVPAVFVTLTSANTVVRATSALFVCISILIFVLHARINSLMLHTFEINVRNADLVEQLGEMNEQLAVQADSDALTGVVNRRGLLERLDHIDVATTALAFFDLDQFKLVNDSLGHLAGDQLLRTVADRVAAALEPGEFVGRFGGDEFVVVLHTGPVGDEQPRSGSARTLRRIDQIRLAVAEPMTIEGRPISVSTSIGVAIGPSGGADGPSLLSHADAALRSAKDSGRNRLEVYNDTVRSRILSQMDDENIVRRAISNGEIVPWYQPIVDTRTGRVVAAEVLARWLTPQGATISANDFISIATESGLIERLCEVVTERAIDDVREIEHYWPDGFRLGVNLPPKFLSATGRVQRLTSLLRSAPHQLITLEIAERSHIDDFDFAVERLRALREQGISIVLDDFGTGMASLTMLQQLPLDGVKIDRSFVRDVATDTRDRALVQGLLAMSNGLGLSVVAEGIEDVTQRDALLALGCTHQQGFLFGAATDVFGLRDHLIHMPGDYSRAEMVAVPGQRRRGSPKTGGAPMVGDRSSHTESGRAARA